MLTGFYTVGLLNNEECFFCVYYRFFFLGELVEECNTGTSQLLGMPAQQQAVKALHINFH